MRFLKAHEKQLTQIINEVSYRDLQIFTRFVNDVAPGPLQMTRLNSTKKVALVKYLTSLLSKKENIKNIYKKLSSTDISNYLYAKLLWEGALDTDDVLSNYKYNFLEESTYRYGISETQQDGILLFITRLTQDENYYSSDIDKLVIKDNMKALLKFVFVVPNDFDLVGVNEFEKTEFTYSNENEVFNFINVISEMLRNNLVEFGKTNEKPLAKSLNILKLSTGINEFYSEKKLDFFATDMLTRSFSYYYWATKKFQDKELDSLKDFVGEKFKDKYYFFITRILASHLKKIRYDHHYLREDAMFSLIKLVMNDLPEDSWVDVHNIIKYCNYREYRIDLEGRYKTDGYYMESDLNGEVFNLYAKEQYNIVFLEPIIKGLFFYLGALGLVELKYNTPTSPYAVTAKGKSYISTWDGLRYIKLTNLGKYIFGFSGTYEQKIIAKKTTTVKFDEYKPIVTISASDTISQAKLEQFCDKYDENRYILSYAKIFRDCKTKKVLDSKIDSFYKNIELNPPKVFKDFFDEIKKDSNLLKRDLKQVVIELDNNKKLLDLFMKNKKLQELVIKAQGYRIIVLKDDISKLTKILKDNGFFVEF